MEELAGPGETLCTEAVRLLAQGWGSREFESLGGHELRGLAEPVVIHRVRTPIADRLGMPDALDAIRRFEFVGRRDEWSQLRANWRESRALRGKVVVLAGEPGIGKSRLCREFARSVRGDGAIVLFGRCSEQAGVPYQPFVQVVRQVLARIADAGELLGPGAGELSRIVPELSTHVGGLVPPAEVDADTARHRQSAAMATWLVELSRRAPILLVLDDLSWADEASIGMLRHVASAIVHESVMIVATYRPADAATSLASFSATSAPTSTGSRSAGSVREKRWTLPAGSSTVSSMTPRKLR